MTKKKKTILETALRLFSEQGVNATSTAKISKAANVSEGLIFRHFKNKEGLLESIMELGKEKAQTLFASIQEHQTPEEKLKAILNIPFSIPKSDHPFWKLLYSLKWQADVYDAEMSSQLKELLVLIFSELNYKNPEWEAEFTMMLFDGMATAILLKDFQQKNEILETIYSKYNLK